MHRRFLNCALAIARLSGPRRRHKNGKIICDEPFRKIALPV